MDTLKKLVTLIAVMDAGYFLYQYFITTPERDYEEEESIPAYALPAMSETCQSKVQELEKAIYGHGSHPSSAAHLRAHRGLKSCLRDWGFSSPEIRGTILRYKDT